MSFAILTIYRTRKLDKNILESIRIEYEIGISFIKRNKLSRARVEEQFIKEDKFFKTDLDSRIIIKLISTQIWIGSKVYLDEI